MFPRLGLLDADVTAKQDICPSGKENDEMQGTPG